MGTIVSLSRETVQRLVVESLSGPSLYTVISKGELLVLISIPERVGVSPVLHVGSNVGLPLLYLYKRLTVVMGVRSKILGSNVSYPWSTHKPLNKFYWSSPPSRSNTLVSVVLVFLGDISLLIFSLSLSLSLGPMSYR